MAHASICDTVLFVRGGDVKDSSRTTFFLVSLTPYRKYNFLHDFQAFDLMSHEVASSYFPDPTGLGELEEEAKYKHKRLLKLRGE